MAICLLTLNLLVTTVIILITANRGEMTVAAEDLTSLLKTAEILQVSGLAPSDSSATLNPNHQESSVTGNPRSSSTSSSASSTSAAPPAPRPRPIKQTQQQRRVSTPPPRPKSGDNSINPTDFMDVDMTCVKEVRKKAASHIQ